MQSMETHTVRKSRQSITGTSINRTKEYKNTIVDLQKQKERLEESITKLTEDLIKAEQALAIRDKHFTAEDDARVLKMVETKTSELRTAANKAKSELKSVKAELDLIKTADEALSNENEQIKKDNEAKQAALDRHLVTIKRLSKQKDKAMAELDAIRKGSDTSTGVANEFKANAKIEELQKRIRVLTLNQSGFNLKKDNDRLQREKLEGDHKRNDMKKLIERLTKELEEAQDKAKKERDELKIGYEKQEQELRYDYDRILKELRLLQEERSEWRDEEMRMSTKIRESSDQLKQAKNQHVKIQKEQQAEKSKQENEKKMITQIEQLRLALDEKSLTADGLKRQVEQQKVLIENIEREKRQVMEQIDSTKVLHQTRTNATMLIDFEKLKDIKQLKQKVYDLETQNVALQRIVSVEKEHVIIEQQHIANMGTKELQDNVEMLNRIHQLEQIIFDKEKLNLELMFDRENFNIEKTRLMNHIKDLELVQSIQEEMINKLQENHSGLNKIIVDLGNVLPHDVLKNHPPSSAPANARRGHHQYDTRDLEAVIDAMKRVIEKLQAEKRQTISNVKYMEVLKENKIVKKQLQELDEKSNHNSKRAIQGTAQMQKLVDQNKDLLRSNKKQLTEIKSLEERLFELTMHGKQMQAERDEVRKSMTKIDRSIDANEKRREIILRDDLKDVNDNNRKKREELEKKNQMLIDLRSQLETKFVTIKEMQHTIDSLSKENSKLLQKLHLAERELRESIPEFRPRASDDGNLQESMERMYQELSRAKLERDKYQKLLLKYQKESGEYSGISATNISTHDNELETLRNEYEKLVNDHLFLEKENEELKTEMALFDDVSCCFISR
jgi:chromosome segregation ATPase